MKIYFISTYLSELNKSTVIFFIALSYIQAKYHLKIENRYIILTLRLFTTNILFLSSVSVSHSSGFTVQMLHWKSNIFLMSESKCSVKQRSRSSGRSRKTPFNNLFFLIVHIVASWHRNEGTGVRTGVRASEWAKWNEMSVHNKIKT